MNLLEHNLVLSIWLTWGIVFLRPFLKKIEDFESLRLYMSIYQMMGDLFLLVECRKGAIMKFFLNEDFESLRVILW